MTDMMTIIETESFARDARRVFSDDELDALILALAANPDGGTLIPETGGVRYIRFAAKGHGKGRGARVVYYYGGADIPLFLLKAYFKGRKEKITQQDRRDFRRRAEELVATYRRRR